MITFMFCVFYKFLMIKNQKTHSFLVAFSNFQFPSLVVFFFFFWREGGWGDKEVIIRGYRCYCERFGVSGTSSSTSEPQLLRYLQVYILQPTFSFLPFVEKQAQSITFCESLNYSNQKKSNKNIDIMTCYAIYNYYFIKLLLYY